MKCIYCGDDIDDDEMAEHIEEEHGGQNLEEETPAWVDGDGEDKSIWTRIRGLFS